MVRTADRRPERRRPGRAGDAGRAARLGAGGRSSRTPRPLPDARWRIARRGCGTTASTGRPVASTSAVRTHPAGPAFEQQRDQAPEREPGERARGEQQNRGNRPGRAPLVAGEITVPAGASRFSRAVRCARRLTSSFRSASASWPLNMRLAGLPTWAAAVARRRSSTTRRVWLSSRSIRASVTSPNRSLTVREVGGGDRVRDSLGDDRVARREGDLQDLGVGRDGDPHPTLQLLSGACPGTSTALSTSADRATWASVARLVSWSCRTEAGVGVNGLPAVGFTRTRVVLVYVDGIDPPYSQPAKDPATSQDDDGRWWRTARGEGARPGARWMLKRHGARPLLEC